MPPVPLPVEPYMDPFWEVPQEKEKDQREPETPNGSLPVEPYMDPFWEVPQEKEKDQREPETPNGSFSAQDWKNVQTYGGLRL